MREIEAFFGNGFLTLLDYSVRRGTPHHTKLIEVAQRFGYFCTNIFRFLTCYYSRVNVEKMLPIRYRFKIYF